MQKTRFYHEFLENSIPCKQSGYNVFLGKFHANMNSYEFNSMKTKRVVESEGEHKDPNPEMLVVRVLAYG